MIRNYDRVRVYKAKVRLYENALGCYNSDIKIGHCDLASGGSVGVHAISSSFPTIQQCSFDANLIGVKTYESNPCIGRVGSYQGLCSFVNNHDYYIYHIYLPPAPETLYAQDNYYGGTPVPSKFYAPLRNSAIKYSPWARSVPPPRLDPNQEMPQAFSLSQNFPNILSTPRRRSAFRSMPRPSRP